MSFNEKISKLKERSKVALHVRFQSPILRSLKQVQNFAVNIKLLALHKVFDSTKMVIQNKLGQYLRCRKITIINRTEQHIHRSGEA